mmetsp:Transcript_30847/g.63919  ORF Transcript_30847/g.63919 Transcript_30847/m.63919 type:complete len:129 (+) Transcript_30847:716-1102(+)
MTYLSPSRTLSVTAGLDVFRSLVLRQQRRQNPTKESFRESIGAISSPGRCRNSARMPSICSMEMAQQNGLNPLEEGVEEWTAENVDVKGPELIASSLPLQAAIKKAREAAKEMMVEYPPLDINRLPVG